MTDYKLVEIKMRYELRLFSDIYFQEMYVYLHSNLQKISGSYGEVLLETRQNPISLGKGLLPQSQQQKYYINGLIF